MSSSRSSLRSHLSTDKLGHVVRAGGRWGWLLPIMAASLLAILSFWGGRDMQASLSATLEDRLDTLLETQEAAALRWLESQERTASLIARNSKVRRAAVRLKAMAEEGTPADALSRSAAMGALREELRAASQVIGSNHFSLLTADGLNIAVEAGREPDLLRRMVVEPAALRTLAMVAESGRAQASRPFLAGLPPAPRMLVAAPVLDGQAVVAVLALELDEAELSQCFSHARLGESGEAYAFSREGLMLSPSRFATDLASLGLLDAGQQSTLRLALRDPGADLSEGGAPATGTRPLTRSVAAAISDGRGSDIAGYRDYRGVRVIGSWTWLERYDFGVVVEIDHREAYQMVASSRRTMAAMLIGLVLAAIGLVGVAMLMSRMQARVDEAQRHLTKMGQYSLLRELGSGGMGTVYLARHELLQRPTALKVLKAKGSEKAIARFEQEVRRTASLEHPNTIQIFDFGVTASGDFYYAMEHLQGLDLEQLIARDGPQPPGRVVQLLAQVCASLNEAHQANLVHRDLKPANIYLACRGGEFDVVKVLDFGLVKDMTDGGGLTMSGAISGTPGYIAPEAIQGQAVDPRADLFALGVVAFELLCGKMPYEGSRAVDMLSETLDLAASIPEEAGVPADLAAVVLRCMAADPSRRPRSARAARAELLACECAGQWAEEAAEAWWGAYRGSSPEEVIDE